MVQMWIDIIFLGLVLMPIFILFAALYQNLLEIPRAEQKVRQKESHIKNCVVDQIQHGDTDVIDEILKTIKRLTK
jgi:hypothetical protein